MRANLPVTQRNHVLPEDQSLVSVTDLKGGIIYCNAAFVAASGHDRDELPGQAHYLVRHPGINFNAVLEAIRHGSAEQQQGISQVNEAVTQMDTITQQNAAMVEELAATAGSLSSQVDSVSNAMRMFRLTRGELTLPQIDAVNPRRPNKRELLLQS